MGKRGIEHREKESVLDLYRICGKSNWGLFAGSELVDSYDGGDTAAGETKLQQYLDMLEDSDTKATFTLKMYPETAKAITNKTPHAASTTMMLNADAPVTTDPKTGMIVVDYTAARKTVGNTESNSFLLQRLDKMEAENKALFQALHNNQIKALEDKLDRAISGMSATPPVDGWDELAKTIAHRPEVVADTIGKIADIFLSRRDPVNYTHNVPLAGTTAKEENPPAEMKDTETQTEEKTFTEKEVEKFHDDQQEASDNLEDRFGIENFTLFLQGLAAMPDKDLIQWSDQEEALNRIRQRLQPEVVTKMLVTVANLNDKDLNKLLNHLD